jgi:hypothetical protein
MPNLGVKPQGYRYRCLSVFSGVILKILLVEAAGLESASEKARREKYVRIWFVGFSRANKEPARVIGGLAATNRRSGPSLSCK